MSINMVSENIYLYCASITESHKILFMYDSIESGNFVISVFLDFKKAFDTVDHKILLSKFDFDGIRGVSHEGLNHILVKEIK